MIINNQSDKLEVSKKVSQKIVNADGSVETKESTIVSEHFIELIINENLAARLVCTPSCLTELVLGRMVSEGYINCADDVESIYICNYGSRAKVFLKKEIILEEAAENEPTCCTDNRVLLKNTVDEPFSRLQKTEWKSEWIFDLANEFASGSMIHRATKGTHCCYLSVNGKIVYAAEDIGRHNAMDKAIGYAVLNGFDRKECILFTTGRVPTDMVKKVIKAGIPVLVSKAVPTDAAVLMASNYNLTLICRAWPDRYEIFNEAE